MNILSKFIKSLKNHVIPLKELSTGAMNSSTGAMNSIKSIFISVIVFLDVIVNQVGLSNKAEKLENFDFVV